MPHDRPPQSFRPDRFEIISEAGKQQPIDLCTGVVMDCLVGQHNGARNLTTGLVTFTPGAALPYHTHVVSESVTLLSGAATAKIEGREYVLKPLDNVVIPSGLAHSVCNTSQTERALFHVALASATPAREWILTPFTPKPMPDTSTGIPHKERITRFTSAPRSEAGPGTSFIDYFNQDLMPGIEMSGGYGLFQPGGRLPAHFHDFDESICIIDGTATCVCEGRRRLMSDGATALQPRGRIHYFINESNGPMAMLWVYAGPVPERLITDESYAVGERDPWASP